MSKGEKFVSGMSNEVTKMTDNELQENFIACIKKGVIAEKGYYLLLKSVIMLEAIKRNLPFTDWK